MPAGSIVIREFAGVDLSKHPRDLADVQLAWSRNVYGSSKGVLETRPGFRFLDAESYTVGNRVERAQLIPFRDKTGREHVILWRSFNATSAALYDMKLAQYVAWPTPFLTIPAGPIRPSYVVWQQKLYLFTGTGQSGYLIDADENGVLVADPAKYPDVGLNWTSKVRPTVVTIHDGSFLFAGFEPPFESFIRWGENEDPGALLRPDTEGIILGANDGDRIVGAATVAITGGATFVEPYTFVFKRRSTWTVHGVPPEAGTSGNIVGTPINQKEGLVAKETICHTPHGLIWCSGRNVWMAPRGGMPVPIGAAIAPYLSKKAQEESDSWHATFFNDFYRLTVPSDLWRFATGGGANMSTPSQTEEWWCDLREYPEYVAWWGPMMIPSSSGVVSVNRDGLESLFRVAVTRLFHPTEWAPLTGYLVGDMVVRFGQGVVYRCTVAGTSGAVNPAIGVGDGSVTWAVAGFTDIGDALQVYEDGQPISGTTNIFETDGTEIRFKEFDFGDPMLDKLFQGMELHLWTSEANAAAVEMYGNGGAIRRLPAGTSVGGAGNNLLDTMVLAAAATDESPLLAEEFQSIAVHPPGGERLVAKTFQPVVKSSMFGDVTRQGINTKLSGVGMRVRVIGRRP